MMYRLIGSALAAGMMMMSGQAAAVEGKAVSEATCAACHNTGVAEAPKLGDKAAWEPRLKDLAAIKTSALKGKGVMPPKGGNVALADADVLAAVEYMVSKAK